MTAIIALIVLSVVAFASYQVGHLVGYDRGWARNAEITKRVNTPSTPKVETVAVSVKPMATAKARKATAQKATKTTKAAPKKATKRGPGRPRKNS